MPASVLTVVMGVASIGFSAWSLVSARNAQRGIARLRSTALQEFRTIVVRSEFEDFRFDGATAEIVMQEEVGGPGGAFSRYPPYTLTLYARNQSGQYFMYISSPPHTSIKHVRPEIARIVLRNRYVNPTDDPQFQRTTSPPPN